MARRKKQSAAQGPQFSSTRTAAVVFCLLAIGGAMWLFRPGTPSSGPNTVLEGLSVGPDHGCVIRKEYAEQVEGETQSIIDSGVWCWGRNDNGELGDGLGGPTAYAANVRSQAATTGAVRVAGITNPRSVTVVGTDRTCAVSESGELWCWGVRRPFGMEREYWQNSSYGTATETGRANRLSPELVMSGVKGFYAYSIDRPALGVEDLDRYVCAITRLGSGDGVSCWGVGQGQMGANGVRDLGMSPAAVDGLPAGGEILTLALRADRACATVVLPGVEETSQWCWEHRLAFAEVIDESAPYVVNAFEAGQSYSNDLHENYGLTLRDAFLSGDGEPYCQIPVAVTPSGNRLISMVCRGYDELPFYFSGHWLDTGKPLGDASSSPETRWFGSALHVDGGSTNVLPGGVTGWLGQISATGSYICAGYRLSGDAAPNRDPNTDGVYCYARVPAPGGSPQTVWAGRAIRIPGITRAGDEGFLSTIPTLYELQAVANDSEDGNGCALIEEDLLLCWGSNELGQLGSGDTADRPDGYFVRFNLGSE